MRKDVKTSINPVLPQQFPLPEDWVVDRVEGLQADVQVLNPHVGQLLGVGLLDACDHRLRVGQRAEGESRKEEQWPLGSADADPTLTLSIIIWAEGSTLSSASVQLSQG